MAVLKDEEVAAELATAGIEFINRVAGKVQTPLRPVLSPASARPEDGRFDCDAGEIVDVEDPDFARKVNAAWIRMAVDYGLFDYSGSSPEPILSWVRARLRDDWDIAGSGVGLLRSPLIALFPGRFLPEFTSLSLDHRVLVGITAWGNGTVSTIAVQPEF